jgi:uncharacterized membrane protein YeaQ/YmgE (transglycosylase-associated protein family)
MLLLAILVFGLFVGWAASSVLGHRHRPSGRDLVIGIVGSYIGGLFVSVLAGDGLAIRPSGLIGSFAGAVLLVALVRLVDGEPRKRHQP